MSGPYVFTATDIREDPLTDYHFETEDLDGNVISRGRTKGTFRHQVWRIRKRPSTTHDGWNFWLVFPIESKMATVGFETFDKAIAYATTRLPGERAS